jgi:hypothetical protein
MGHGAIVASTLAQLASILQQREAWNDYLTRDKLPLPFQGYAVGEAQPAHRNHLHQIGVNLMIKDLTAVLLKILEGEDPEAFSAAAKQTALDLAIALGKEECQTLYHFAVLVTRMAR